MKKMMMSKYGKIGLYLFIAYQIVGLIIVVMFFDDIMLEANTIAQQIIKGKK